MLRLVESTLTNERSRYCLWNPLLEWVAYERMLDNMDNDQQNTEPSHGARSSVTKPGNPTPGSALG